MTVTIRRLTGPDEFPAMSRNDMRAFSTDRPMDEIVEAAARMLGAGGGERVWVGDDGGEIVSNIGTIPFELTMPGRRVTPVAGITWVAVSPTHRRQGLMRRGMDAAVADARARGETMALLYASEASIYRRVGFGMATHMRSVAIDVRRTSLERRTNSTAASTARLRYVDTAEAGETLPAIFDRGRPGSPGVISRHPGWWTHHVADPPRATDGMSAPFVVVHPDGYVRYRSRERWIESDPQHLIEIDELLALTDDAHTALWGFMLDLDLVSEVVVPRFALDDPLIWRLTNPRALRTTAVNDAIWVRVLDTAAALSARRYATRSEVVLEIVGGGPRVAGRWHLDGGPDHAACSSSRGEVDITLDAADLGSIVLGGVSPEALRRAGRVAEHRPGESARLAAMFASDPLPFCTTAF